MDRACLTNALICRGECVVGGCRCSRSGPWGSLFKSVGTPRGSPGRLVFGDQLVQGRRTPCLRRTPRGLRPRDQGKDHSERPIASRRATREHDDLGPGSERLSIPKQLTARTFAWDQAARWQSTARSRSTPGYRSSSATTPHHGSGPPTSGRVGHEEGAEVDRSTQLW